MRGLWGHHGAASSAYDEAHLEQLRLLHLQEKGERSLHRPLYPGMRAGRGDPGGSAAGNGDGQGTYQGVCGVHRRQAVRRNPAGDPQAGTGTDRHAETRRGTGGHFQKALRGSGAWPHFGGAVPDAVR